MNQSRRLAAALRGAALAVAALGGCASLKPPPAPVPDVAKVREEREHAVVREFEAQRDFAQFQAALNRWQQGDALGCRGDLERLLARNPNHVDGRLLLAEVLLSDGQAPAAIAQLEPMLAVHPQDRRLHAMMGRLLEESGKPEAALAHYQQAAATNPAEAVRQVGYETQEDASAGREGGATEDWAPGAAGTSPSQPPPLAPAAPGPPESPIHPADPVASAPADFSPSGVGTRFVAPPPEGGYAESPVGSASGYRAGQTGRTGAWDLVREGEAALSSGSYDAAMAYFHHAMSLEPDDPQIPISAGVAALRYNQPEAAVSLLTPAATAFPDSAAIRRILAVAYYRQGAYRSSQVALQQALSLDNSSALSYFLMGCTLAKLGEPASAEAHFLQARRLDPRYAARR